MLALRYAASVLVLTGAGLAWGLPFLPLEALSILSWFGGVVAAVCACGLVYGVVYAFPSSKVRVPADEPCGKPEFAVRAGFGVGLALWVAGLVVVDSLRFDPYGRVHEVDFARCLLGAALGGLVAGWITYLFSAVFYLRTLNSKQDETSLPVGLAAMMLFNWIRGIFDEARSHPFWFAVGTSTWTVGTISLAITLGCLAYARMVPHEYNPLRRAPRKVPAG
jgi:hypothetical protein